MANICTCVIRILDGGPDDLIEAIEKAKTAEEMFRAVKPCSAPNGSPEFKEAYGAHPDWDGNPYIVQAEALNDGYTEVMFFTAWHFPWRLLAALHQHGCKFEAGAFEPGNSYMWYWHTLGDGVDGGAYDLPQTPGECFSLPYGAVMLLDLFCNLFDNGEEIPEHIRNVLPPERGEWKHVRRPFEEFIGSEELPPNS